MKKLLTFLLGILTYLTGGFDSLIKCLVIFMILDYITGILKGIYKKELSSKKSLKGIIKKIGYIFIIILGTVFDRVTNNNEFTIRTLVIYFFIANEAISIIENWMLMDLPLPKKLKVIFEDLKNE